MQHHHIRYTPNWPLGRCHVVTPRSKRSHQPTRTTFTHTCLRHCHRHQTNNKKNTHQTPQKKHPPQHLSIQSTKLYITHNKQTLSLSSTPLLPSTQHTHWPSPAPIRCRGRPNPPARPPRRRYTPIGRALPGLRATHAHPRPRAWTRVRHPEPHLPPPSDLEAEVRGQRWADITRAGGPDAEAILGLCRATPGLILVRADAVARRHRCALYTRRNPRNAGQLLLVKGRKERRRGQQGGQSVGFEGCGEGKEGRGRNGGDLWRSVLKGEWCGVVWCGAVWCGLGLEVCLWAGYGSSGHPWHARHGPLWARSRYWVGEFRGRQADARQEHSGAGGCEVHRARGEGMHVVAVGSDRARVRVFGMWHGVERTVLGSGSERGG